MLDETTKLRVDRLSNTIVGNSDKLATQRVNNSSFDKTMYGTVIKQEVVDRVEEPISGTTAKRTQWTVLCSGNEYKIWQTDCDITSVGQSVRVFIPNNKGTKLYAEVVKHTNKTYLLDHPSACAYNWQTHKITETWLLTDGTEEELVYELKIRTDSQTGEDEVYQMVLPDTTTIDLTGFFIDRFS